MHQVVKCVAKKIYMECQICKKHVCFKSGKNMTSLSCSIDFHDDLMYGLGSMDRVELFGVKKSQFKKANARGSTVQVPASFFWNRKNKWAEVPRHLLL